MDRFDELISLRRQFHKRPELSWKETETIGFIKKWLEAEGFKEIKSVAETGLSTVVKGKTSGKTILYRADIDALPIIEDSGVDYQSESEGVMHACGHDAHIAIALILASILNQQRHKLKGNVKFVFQPAEEVGAGAKAMIKEGVMNNPSVDHSFGLHIAAELPSGSFGIASGAICAAVANFNIEVLGKGGHAASPHKTIDPIVIGAQIVNALQTVVSRNINPLQPSVLTIGTFHAGTKENIISDRAAISGTIRSFDMALMDEIPKRIETIVKGITDSMEAGYRFSYELHCPPVVNDNSFTTLVMDKAIDLVGESFISEVRIAAADDMAYFLEEAPGCFYFLGVADRDIGPQVHHQSRFTFDDKALALGVELSLKVIEDFLT
jgi:amidohydrolase